MTGKSRKKKKQTIFRIFLIPLIAIMLIQSLVTIGSLVTRRITNVLEEYSSGMMSRLVENRKVILQNDMNQRWSSIRDQEMLMNGILEQFLRDRDIGMDQLMASEARRNELLGLLFPECVDLVRNNSTTGIFLVLTGPDMQAEGDYDGFFIRDSDPDTSPANHTDLLLEKGNKQLSREWNIPLDTHWTTHFHMDGQGNNASDDYFYEPWRAGVEHEDAAAADLGYWSMPFCLEKKMPDPYEMITYSLPLRYEGQVYGVLGVEISCSYLNDYFPVTELNDARQSGYLLAVRQEDGSYVPLVGKGVLYGGVRAQGDTFILQDTGYDNLYLVKDTRIEDQYVFAVACPLRLYSNNVPYENTEWVLLGLKTEEDLFGMSRRLYVWMVAAILVGLAFGVAGIYFTVRYLTKPVQRLMQCISRGNTGLQEFGPSNILEIDALYEVVKDLTDRQKEAQNILLEEKERYRVALETTADTFFSYDFQNHTLDIVNHKTMSGQWKCMEYESGFIDPEYIHESDRMTAIRTFHSLADKLYVELRLNWPEKTAYVWTAFSGNVVFDADGRRRKLVGSIRNIQKQKEREAEQLRKVTMDGVTGLYVFSAGMEKLQECRRIRQTGYMAHLFVDQLQETNEKNGIVFGDMILEEIGELIRDSCQKLTGETDSRTMAFRLDADEFVLWLERQSRQQAAEFTESLIGEINGRFAHEMFNIAARAGLAGAEKGQADEELIRMAKLAQEAVVPGAEPQYCFYEDIPAEKRRTMPALHGCEINSLDYSEDVSLVSLALNLFGKGNDFPAQMSLMLRKIGRYYHASDVLVSILRADFHSNYLEYQWHEDKEPVTDNVRQYREEERDSFYLWLGQEKVRYFTPADSRRKVIQCFLNVMSGQQGVALPLYDNGSYVGNLCIIGADPRLAEHSGDTQNLAELGSVIQGQLNQQQHDIASKAKSDFLSRMSHEIRTPMNGIIGMTAIALQQGQSPDKVMDCLQKIQSSSDYLLGLINDILDMSKIESGKMKLEPADFNIHEMLATVMELITPQGASKGIRFEQDIRLDHTWFCADRMRISQVLINLLGNAVKFTPENGRVTLQVHEIRANAEEATVSFAVQDTGIGIAREDQRRVFRAFEQAGNKNPSKLQGTGLGLSISGRLIQMMGSAIELESELGAGSTFRFSLPLPFGEDREPEVQEEEFSFEGCRILVVEDNELNAEIAQSLLEERGFRVDCVHDGAQAVERIRSTEPGTYDAVLMDIMMPVMDGLEATRTIRRMERADCRTLPIIAMSANAFDDDLKKSVECGMNGHLSKPVEVDKLFRKLREVIR
ncbi:MAG: response regulator [Lachnospiraceae bacterium]|nr:response regulator [Lachnospiraceae bacterium]MCM1238031.1 response regulator [Lachnospiraceae bacterium]MCM1302542.1 response regulator [Butyrivibrio sp.]MCM1342330.1 response regulator [Muribaculaceae bacterium]MCM1410903.1 response regulator [Lachnospiraceae bacterium]